MNVYIFVSIHIYILYIIVCTFSSVHTTELCTYYLKMVKMVNFMLRVFYYNLIFFKKEGINPADTLSLEFWPPEL